VTLYSCSPQQTSTTDYLSCCDDGVRQEPTLQRLIGVMKDELVRWRAEPGYNHAGAFGAGHSLADNRPAQSPRTARLECIRHARDGHRGQATALEAEPDDPRFNSNK
jgi:hypothetical protein